MKIRITKKFAKQYSNLPKRVKRAVVKKERIFIENPFDSRLQTHKLHGKEKETWSFSINKDYRVKFIFVKEQEVLFFEVGTHEIYR